MLNVLAVAPEYCFVTNRSSVKLGLGHFIFQYTFKYIIYIFFYRTVEYQKYIGIIFFIKMHIPHPCHLKIWLLSSSGKYSFPFGTWSIYFFSFVDVTKKYFDAVRWVRLRNVMKYSNDTIKKFWSARERYRASQIQKRSKN